MNNLTHQQLLDFSNCTNLDCGICSNEEICKRSRGYKILSDELQRTQAELEKYKFALDLIVRGGFVYDANKVKSEDKGKGIADGWIQGSFDTWDVLGDSFGPMWD